MNEKTSKSKMKGGPVIEVDFYDERSLDPITRIVVRTFGDALTLIARELKKGGEIYNATVFGTPEANDLYYAKERIWRNYFFNGARIVELREPWVLSREQARNLDVVDGRLIGLPEIYQRKEGL